jgi:hypothetical protein
MTKEEIIELANNSIKTKPTMSLTELMYLRQVANVNLEMNRDENEYFYKVKIDELVDKDFKKEIISDNGWEVSKDKEFIILFIN